MQAFHNSTGNSLLLLMLSGYYPRNLGGGGGGGGEDERKAISDSMCNARPNLIVSRPGVEKGHWHGNARFLWPQDNGSPPLFRHYLFLTCSHKDNLNFSLTVMSDT